MTRHPRLLFAFAALLWAQTVHASEAKLSDLTFIDETRPIKTSPAAGFAGSKTRRIDVKVWRPADGDGPWPLIVYSHGTFGSPDNAMHLVNALVADGYIVAAPTYPLTSRSAFTRIASADISDVSEQTKDISFVIDSLLAHPELGRLIDKDRIGTTGHSLGAVTSYFSTFGRRTRDPRITATAPIAAGDPVQTALDNEMGLSGTGHAAVSVPVLFLSASNDVFARMTGRPGAAYARVEAPKYELMIDKGVHVWFGDASDRPADNKNPDCLFFEKWAPQMVVPGCEQRVPLIAPQRQQEITRAAVLAFFGAYLKGNAEALVRLRGLGKEFGEARLVFVD